MYRLTFIIFFLLTALFIRIFTFYSESTSLENGQEVDFKSRLQSSPKTSARSQTFSVTYGGQRIFIATDLFPEYSYGQQLHISGVIQKKKLKDSHVLTSLSHPKIEVVKGESNPLMTLALTIRDRTTILFKQTLPYNYASLLSGIVLGAKEQFSKEFEQDLKSSGVMHVVAASGMNVTLIGAMLMNVLTVMLRRQYAILATIGGIIFYCVMAGLEPSIVRASIMGSIAFSAQILGKQTISLFSLAITGFLMLIYDPSQVSDIGFQLSFMATLGIILLSPMLNFKFLSIPKTIKQDLSTTLSAQIATLPILLFNFGTYSLWSILVNVFVLWTVPILMVIGGFGALLGILFEPFGRLIILLAYPLLLYFEYIIRFFSQLPGQFEILLPWELMAGYYAVFFFVLLYLKRPK